MLRKRKDKQGKRTNHSYLLLHDGVFVFQPLHSVLQHLAHHIHRGAPQHLTYLFHAVDWGNFVLIGRDTIYEATPPVGLHGPHAGLHPCSLRRSNHTALSGLTQLFKLLFSFPTEDLSPATISQAPPEAGSLDPVLPPRHVTTSHHNEYDS